MERNTIAEMRRILDAIEQGKNIQFSSDGVYWSDTGNIHPDFSDYIYRIKPAGPKKWRPFGGITECHDAIGRHGAWVINTHNDQHCQIVAYDAVRVLIAQSTKTYAELLENFIFVDGTPCGEEI